MERTLKIKISTAPPGPRIGFRVRQRAGQARRARALARHVCPHRPQHRQCLETRESYREPGATSGPADTREHNTHPGRWKMLVLGGPKAESAPLGAARRPACKRRETPTGSLLFERLSCAWSKSATVATTRSSKHPRTPKKPPAKQSSNARPASGLQNRRVRRSTRLGIGGPSHSVPAARAAPIKQARRGPNAASS